MFPTTSAQQYISEASLTNYDETINNTSFLFHSTKEDANPIFSITPVLDTVSNMRICRVCLAMDVKMYHLSESKLTIMFEKIIGVQINEEDMLPQMLCWECVARLSSANNFVEKAFKTQWILLDKINSFQFITASDINLISESHNHLKSSLGVKNFKVNEYNLYINEEETENQNKVGIEFIERNNRINRENEIVNDIEDEDSILRVFGTDEYDIPISDVVDELVGLITEGGVDPFEENDGEPENIINCDEFLISDKNPSQEVADNNRKDKSAAEEEKNDELSKVTKQVDTETSLNNPTCDSKHIEDMVSSHINQQMSNDLSALSIMNNIMSLLDDNNLEETTNKDNIEVPHQNTSHVNPDIVDTDISFPHDPSEVVKNLFICHVCNKSFDEKTTLRKHMFKHSKLFNCSSCEFKTSNKFILNTHIEIKHTKKGVYTCDHCSYKTHIKKYLIAHINASHPTTKTKHFNEGDTFNCPSCTYKTYCKKSLNTHINTKHVKKISYDCSYCSFKTYHKRYLTEHVNAKHTKDVAFSCTFCDFKTYTRQYLATHIKVKHTQSISYNCSLCNFKTFRKNYLAIHVNTKHTKHVSYTCTMCSFKTYLKNYLTKHINEKHAQNESYKCSMCNFTTYQKSYLATHINAKHTRDISYKCSSCGFIAYQKSSLTRHIRVKHGKQKER